jgi:hypothetical protein
MYHSVLKGRQKGLRGCENWPLKKMFAHKRHRYEEMAKLYIEELLYPSLSNNQVIKP